MSHRIFFFYDFKSFFDLQKRPTQKEIEQFIYQAKFLLKKEKEEHPIKDLILNPGVVENQRQKALEQMEQLRSLFF